MPLMPVFLHRKEYNFILISAFMGTTGTVLSTTESSVYILNFFPILRGGSRDGNKEDGREVGGHQFAQDFPLQKDFYDDPRVWVRAITVLEPPIKNRVNRNTIPFF